MTDNITLPRSVVEQATKALENRESTPVEYDTYHALRAALEQKCPCGATQQSQIDECAYANCAALEQAQVEQEPLTDEMIWEIYRNHAPCVGFARAIERAVLKVRNDR